MTPEQTKALEPHLQAYIKRRARLEKAYSRAQKRAWARYVKGLTESWTEYSTQARKIAPHIFD